MRQNDRDGDVHMCVCVCVCARGSVKCLQVSMCVRAAYVDTDHSEAPLNALSFPLIRDESTFKSVTEA